LNLLDNLVNGLSALASGSNNAKERKKESTLSGKLADGRVSFEDALSHIYPETSPRTQAPGQAQQYQPQSYEPEQSYQPAPTYQTIPTYRSTINFQPEPTYQQSNQQSVSVESVTIYDAYKGLSARSYDSLPAALASLNQGQLSSADNPLDEQEDSIQSQADTYDNLPAQPYQDLSVQATSVQVYEEPQSFETCTNTANTRDLYSQSTFDNLMRVQEELSQQILGNYVESAASVNREFLDGFISSSKEFLDSRNKPAEPVYTPSSMSTSMTSLVDKIFNTLEPYIHELNQSFRTTDLSITFTPPSVVNENFGFDSSRRPALIVTSYRCRISTTRLALVIRGKEDRIDFFILPVESVMGLSKIEDQHDPLMSFTCEVKRGEFYWEVEEKPLTEERLEKYILLIFEHLMELTREELLRRPAYAGAF
jgi:hypothetical protein